MPSARAEGSMVAINNKIYLFGGYGYVPSGELGYLNDTWEFDPTTNNWKWIKGENFVNSAGNFGILNVANNSNEIPSTFSQFTWVLNNKIYVFGGYNIVENQGAVLSNSLWEYNPSTNIWTWLKGDNDFVPHAGIYGTLGLAAINNKPGSRYGGFQFAHEGKLFLLGGNGYDISLSNYSEMSDLWEFNIATNNWRWLKGPNLVSQNGVLGTQGAPNINNNPAGTAYGSSSFINNKFLIFGGYSFGVGRNADLWEYTPAITCTSMSTVASGNWNTEATWSCGRLPLATDIVTINAHTIDITANCFAKNVIYNGNGTLRLGVGGNLVLKP